MILAQKKHYALLLAQTVELMTGKGWMTMIDREKVIQGLRFCFDGFCFDEPLGIVSCDGCVYSDSKTFKNGVTHCCLGDEAIELLKEQEAEIERLKKLTAGDNKIPLKW